MMKSRISTLQNNLPAIRKLLGWSANVLGDKIGVTKQTISNLENKKTEMTKTQYIAVRAVMDYEIGNRNENTYLLETAVTLLDLDSLSDNQKKQIAEAMEFISDTVEKQIEESTIKTMMNTFLDSLGIKTEILTAIALSKANPYYWMGRINEKM